MRHTKHALMVAFHYPPEGSSSGVLRTLKFTRYLGDYGWNVTVLTIHASAYAEADSSLESQVPRPCNGRTNTISRCKDPRDQRPLSVVDRTSRIQRRAPWAWWAIPAGTRILWRERVNVIYSTSPCATAHIIGQALARRSGLPWVMDFRDPWDHDQLASISSPLAASFARSREATGVVLAKRVVASTSALSEAMRARYPAVPPEKFVAISNGYDESDFSSITRTFSPRRRCLEILHAGNLHIGFRDPAPLFCCCRRLLQAGKLRPTDLRIRFLGAGAEAQRLQTVVQLGALQAQVEFLPRLGYASALEHMAAADILLLLQASAHTADLVPAKLYEYARVGRPVLALVTPRATWDEVHRLRAGWTLDPANEDALADLILHVLTTFHAGGLGDVRPAMQELVVCERKRLTGQLAAVFDGVM